MSRSCLWPFMHFEKTTVMRRAGRAGCLETGLSVLDGGSGK